MADDTGADASSLFAPPALCTTFWCLLLWHSLPLFLLMYYLSLIRCREPEACCLGIWWDFCAAYACFRVKDWSQTLWFFLQKALLLPLCCRSSPDMTQLSFDLWSPEQRKKAMESNSDESCCASLIHGSHWLAKIKSIQHKSTYMNTEREQPGLRWNIGRNKRLRKVWPHRMENSKEEE